MEASEKCITVLGLSHSQCYAAEASASQIGSRVVSGVDLYSIVKELVGWAKYIEEPGHGIWAFW